MLLKQLRLKCLLKFIFLILNGWSYIDNVCFIPKPSTLPWVCGWRATAFLKQLLLGWFIFPFLPKSQDFRLELSCQYYMSTSVVALSSSLPFCCCSLKICLCGWVLSYKGFVDAFAMSVLVSSVLRVSRWCSHSMAHASHWGRNHPVAVTLAAGLHGSRSSVCDPCHQSLWRHFVLPRCHRFLPPHLWPRCTSVGKDMACLVTLLVGSAWERREGVLLWRMWRTPFQFVRPKGRIHPCFWNDVTSCLSWKSVQLWLRGRKRFQWWRSLLLSTPLIKTYLEDCLRDSQMQVLTFSKAAEISIYSYNSVKWPKSSGCPWDTVQRHGLLPIPGHLLGALASLM